MIPRSPQVSDAVPIQAIPGCLRVRAVVNGWHAVMEGSSADAGRRVSAALGVGEVRCLPMPLEELFIELTGGER